VPITERSPFSEHWAAAGLPVVLVDDWADITPERLEDEAGRLAGMAPDGEPLRLARYASLVAAAANSASTACVEPRA
jgi:hypothetical protein